MKHARTICHWGLSFCMLGVSACKTEEKLPELGDKLAGPVDMATSPSGSYFYVLNSDYERRFDAGSLLVIDPNAADGSKKVSSIEVKRMGRSLQVAQNHLIVSYADSQSQDTGFVEIYDLTTETQPKIVGRYEVKCLPINAIIAPSTPYFAVSCLGGDLWMGKGLGNMDGLVSTLEPVRSYGYERRALYFYEGAKVWLLGFPSDFNLDEIGDAALEDKASYDLATDTMLPVANGVPDRYEETEVARRRPNLGFPYQMFAYPVTDEEAASTQPQTPETPPYTTFRYVAYGPFSKPTQSNNELSFISFTLESANGLPTGGEGTLDPTLDVYHTNFWEAKPGLEASPGVFYMSQRGQYGSEANNVLKLTIDESQLASVGAARDFSKLFKVERVYGKSIDRDNSGRYPGDFEFATVGGEPMLLVNSFRDLIRFADAPFYSVTRKFLSGTKGEYEQPSSTDSRDFKYSYYQLAVSANGKVLTASFYGNALFLFDADPSMSIKDQTPVRIE